MEPPSTAHRPQVMIGAGLGLGRMLRALTAVLKKLGHPTWADAAADPSPKPDLPPRPRGEEVWRSYAVYSGALSLLHHRSSRRNP